MKYIDYNLPIFKEKEKADLNLYSEEMAKAIKVQIDKFGNPLSYKGTVATITELNLITKKSQGDIYRVTDENKNYIYNGNSWEIYSDNIDISILEKRTHKYIQKITSNIVAGGAFNIPCYYKVGQDVLDVYVNGEKLIKSTDAVGTNGHYLEVGETNSTSNQIKTTTDWGLKTGDILEIVVRGEYSGTET